MNQDQGTPLAVREQIDSDNRLARSRWSNENAGIVGDHGLDGLVLQRRQRSLERDIQLNAFRPLIVDVEVYTKLAEQLLEGSQATARQTDMLWSILGAADDSRYERCRQAHCLLLVELGILKRCETLDLVDQR